MLSPPAIPVGFFARAEVCHGAGVSPTDHQESAPHPSATFRDNGLSTAQADPLRTFGAAYQIENPAAPGLSQSDGAYVSRRGHREILEERNAPLQILSHLFDLPLLSIGLVAVGEKQCVGLSDIYIEALTRFNRDYKAITVVKLLVCTPVTKAIRRTGAHTSLSTVCVYSRPQEIEPLIGSGMTVFGMYREDCRCHRH
jgi:hypothetical protein